MIFTMSCLLAAVLVSAEDSLVLRVGETIHGEAPADAPWLADPEPTGGSLRGVTHRIDRGVDGPITITLRSLRFDGTLLAHDATGDVLARDGDGWYGRHARLDLDGDVLARTTDVTVAFVDGSSGEYELSSVAGVLPAVTSEEARERLVAEGAELVEVATTLQGEGAFAEASSLLERALAIREETLGPTHPETAACLLELSMSRRGGGESAAAVPLAERALKIEEEAHGPSDPRVAAALNELGLGLHRQGAYMEARAAYERALAIREESLGADHPDTATSLSNMGSVLRDLGEFAASLPYSERALEIDRRRLGENHHTVSIRLRNLARALYQLGRTEEAIALVERSIEILEQTRGPNHFEMGHALESLAALHFRRGDDESAAALFERSVRIQEATLGEAHPQLAYALGNLAMVYGMAGRYDEAKPLYERALAIAERALGPEHPQTADCLMGLGDLLLQQGNVTDARPLLERALSILEERLGPEHLEVASVLNVLGALRAETGDLAGARVAFERALAIREARLGPRHPATARSLLELGRLRGDQGEFSEARGLLERALAIHEEVSGPEHPETAVTLGVLAVVLELDGEIEAATERNARALAILEKTLGSGHPNCVAVRGNLAKNWIDQGDHERAYPYAKSAAAGSARHVAAQTRHLSVGARLEALRDQYGFLELLLCASAPLPGTVRDTWSAVLAWKGQAHRALLGLRGREAARSPATEAALERVRDLSSLISTHAYDEDSEDRTAHDEESTRLRMELQRAEEELQRALELDPEWRTVATDDVCAALPADAALVDILVHRLYRGEWGEPMVTAFVARAGQASPARVELGPAREIEAAIDRYLGSFGAQRAAAVPLAEDDRGDALRRLVWDPLRPGLGDARHVVISPDGLLGTLPWGVLPNGEGGFLVEGFEFSYLPDAGALVRMGDGAAPSPAKGVLASGGIDYFRRTDVDDLSEVSLASLRGPSDGGFQTIWPSLLATRDEAVLVADLHSMLEDSPEDSYLLTRGDATEEALKAHLEGRRFVHLATHGYFQPKGLSSMWESVQGEGRSGELRMRDASRALTGLVPGLLSGLVCAGANRPAGEGRDNGLLTASEVGWLDLTGCELVVLSACETALGEARAGEGMLSLQRAFHNAGAAAVIASLWKVPDDATAELMRNFYTRLWVDGEPKGAALRGAQLDLIRKNRIETGSDARPVTWGAFVLSGDWR